MAKRIGRRKFLAGSAAAAAALGAAKAEGSAVRPKQEFYELRIYRTTAAKKGIVSTYLEKALLPALHRQKIDRVGVFTRLDDESDASITVLVPYPTLEAFAALNPHLAADEAYQAAAREYFAQPKKDPAYARIESRLMKAFEGMPVIEMPAQSKPKKPRIFELRIYESHNEDAAWRKVEMFNKGEIQIMRDVKMAPVFYGEMLASSDVPNLTYMLSADDMKSHKEHWNAFRVHPDWQRMKKIRRYAGTVSRITSLHLKPTAYSQI